MYDWYIPKKKVVVAFMIAVMLLSFGRVDAYALFDVNPTVRTGYTVEINGAEQGSSYIATYNDTCYIPLNRLANKLGILYSLNGDLAVFAYQDTVLTVNYENNAVTVNGKEYDLQLGTVRKTIGNEVYLFFNLKDIQNIFGIIASYDASAEKVYLNTGFGVLDVSYALDVNSTAEDQARQKLREYAASVANQAGCIMVENNAQAYGSLDGLFSSINMPINKNEYISGIRITGVSKDTASDEDIKYLMNLKLLSGLAKLNITPEYFGSYELSNGIGSFQIVGAFCKIDGLEISSTDLGVAAVSTVEDSLGVHLEDAAAKEIMDTIAASASSARSVQHYIIAVIQSNEVKVVDVF